MPPLGATQRCDSVNVWSAQYAGIIIYHFLPHPRMTTFHQLLYLITLYNTHYTCNNVALRIRGIMYGVCNMLQFENYLTENTLLTILILSWIYNFLEQYILLVIIHTTTVKIIQAYTIYNLVDPVVCAIHGLHGDDLTRDASS